MNSNMYLDEKEMEVPGEKNEWLWDQEIKK